MAPFDNSQYMDTEATYHMTANEGNPTYYSNMRNIITIGSSHNILVIGLGNASIPNPLPYLTRHIVLHAPK